MENLVQAWLVRVEHFSAEVSKKRAELNEIRQSNSDLEAGVEKDQRLLRAHLAQRALLARSKLPRPGISNQLASLSGRSCHQSLPDTADERLLRVMKKEEAQMAAFDELADKAKAEAIEAELRMQEELDKVMARTSSIEEQTHEAEAAISRSTAEKDARAEACEVLRKELSCVMENNKKLEQEIAKLRAYAAKRAQQLKLNKSKAPETENGNWIQAQKRKDAASERLAQLRHSNVEVERHLQSLERQILDAQGAVQQLCLCS